MAAEFTRDRYGRPLIIPEGGGKPVPYGRFSSHGSVLEDKFNLEKWKIRTTAIGLTQRSDLFAQLAACPISDTKRLNDIMEQALEAGGGSIGANLGTALHEFTQRVDLGELEVTEIAEPWRTDVQAYLNTLQAFNLQVLPKLTEVNLVNDELQLAGTADRFYLDSALNLICADIKTGKQISKNPLAYAVQLAAYANSVLYDIETGERTPIENVCLDYGYIIHIPANQGKCDIYEIDLREAMEAARLASTVKSWQKRTDLVKPLSPAHKPKKTDKKASETPSESILSPANQERNLWVRNRLQPILEACKTELVGLWPDNVPTPSKTESWTDEQIDQIIPILHTLEVNHNLGFPIPDPAQPKPEPRQFSFQKPAVDEGGTEDDIVIIGVRNRLDHLSKPNLAFVKEILNDAKSNGTPITLKNKTVRQTRIIDAVITLSHLAGGDNEDLQLIRTIVETIRTPLPNSPLGHILGTFTTNEAERLEQLAQQIHAGETIINFNDDGSITFKEAQ